MNSWDVYTCHTLASLVSSAGSVSVFVSGSIPGTTHSFTSHQVTGEKMSTSESLRTSLSRKSVVRITDRSDNSPQLFTMDVKQEIKF